MPQPQGAGGVFDRVADTYDAVGVPWFTPIAAGLVEQLAVQPGERVLDIGCGRGAALRPLAEATGPHGRAVGIDLAPRMVELTARDLADLAQVEVLVGDAQAPAFPPASFEVVSASLVLFFLPDPAAALAAWTALVAPGGRVGVTTFGAQDERWRALDEVFLPYLPPALLDARTSGRTGPFATDAGMEGLFAGAGLTQIRTVTRAVHAVARDAEHLLAFTRSHGQRAMWDAVPPEAHDDVRAQVVSLADRLATDGGIALGQEVRYTLGVRPVAS
ncbi:class I SAM-dependent methyltransferase [Cellulomonas edaphi]|uniref:Methyltransferase domain-containing protein n=1 Tax=Cellulomonas edaphi TaxID=3053468 RepID=A0ABT7S405_9CELL|nr:methyltransferase domain-containing protein [Cellulomons edaphi]MDM7830358.1 methyltransferase domain-containing protein [Cellulomons edaphi]